MSVLAVAARIIFDPCPEDPGWYCRVKLSDGGELDARLNLKGRGATTPMLVEDAGHALEYQDVVCDPELFEVIR